MTVHLIVERGKVVAFDSLPNNSIALDGYVQGPAIDAENRRFSFDHHDNCIRHVTKATCEQVLDALLLGLNPQGMNVYINDVDGDTVLSVWLLKNPHAMLDVSVRTLVPSVGSIDALGPAYPARHAGHTRTFFESVMAPERAARRNKTYQTTDLVALLDECLARMDDFFDDGGVIGEPTDVRSVIPEITHRGPGFVMATGEFDTIAALYQVGHDSVIAYRTLPDGSYQYTVAKRSEFVADFNVGPPSKTGSILQALSCIEPGWGGGSTIGGSPRKPDGGSSQLTPDQVFNTVCALIPNKADK